MGTYLEQRDQSVDFGFMARSVLYVVTNQSLACLELSHAPIHIRLLKRTDV